MSRLPEHESRVAVLVDCDNTTPEILEYALRVVAKYGRVVLRRGYGNHGTLANKWQEALVRLAFTPCLQYQYASGKNTSDIALALDAQEALFDQRADTFCLVTSDSDFAYLCRKLRERGATVCIVGEEKTPDALRNASDQFFEWVREEPAPATPPAPPPPVKAVAPVANKPKVGKAPEPPAPSPVPPAAPKPLPKHRPRLVVDAVNLLSADSSEGLVSVSLLGSYLKRADPSFSPKKYGHSSLLQMVKTYDLLTLKQGAGDHWFVQMAGNGT